MSTHESTVRHLLGGLLALALATGTVGCVVEVDEEGELLAMADVASVGDGGDLAVERRAAIGEQLELGAPGLDTEERQGNPEPQPWNEDVGDEEGNPEPQPWRRDGDSDSPEPQPWQASAAADMSEGEEGDEQADAEADHELDAPADDYLDDDEPDPNPWMAEARHLVEQLRSH